MYEALSYAIHPCYTRQLSVQLPSCLAVHALEYVVRYVANLKALLKALLQAVLEAVLQACKALLRW